MLGELGAIVDGLLLRLVLLLLQLDLLLLRLQIFLFRLELALKRLVRTIGKEKPRAQHQAERR